MGFTIFRTFENFICHFVYLWVLFSFALLGKSWVSVSPREANSPLRNRELCALTDGEKLTTKPESVNGLDYAPFSNKISPNSMSQPPAPSSALISNTTNSQYNRIKTPFELILMKFNLDMPLAFALK